MDAVLIFCLKVLGRFLAFIPECIPNVISIVLGDLIYFLPGRLRRGILSNLHHAFPERPHIWHQKIARESCRRTIEMGLFVLASPFFTRQRLQTSFQLDESYRTAIQSGESYVVLVPHFSGMEAITLTSLLFDKPIPETGVIYRPFNNRALERYIKETRQRGGVTLLSRKEGFTRAMEILRRKGNVAVLFDQNAGNQGALTLFFDRLVSATELPGLLVQRFQAACGVLYTERTGFWRGTMKAETLHVERSTHAVTLVANQWLENQLKSNDNACADWLWLHRRWKTQNEGAVSLRLQASRNLLNETLIFRNLNTLPKKTRIWIRMPNWLGDLIMALPLIQSLKKGRPDAEITLLVQKPYADFLKALKVADCIEVLPEKGCLYFWEMTRFRDAFIDRLIIMTHSLRSDLEALCILPEVSHGCLLPGRSRFKVNEVWNVPANITLSAIHQTDLWGLWFKNLGLEFLPQKEPIFWKGDAQDFSVYGLTSDDRYIGVIAGSENSPEKRWSIQAWREFLGHVMCLYPDYKVVLFGTRKEESLVHQIVTGFQSEQMISLVGKTDLMAFAHILSKATVVIGNDTGGLHLANMLGRPVIGLYGPTNPKRTGPIFEAPCLLLQPPGCPAEGGGRMEDLKPAHVLKALENILNSVII